MNKIKKPIKNKKFYYKPVLKKFGALKALTLSGSQPMMEGTGSGNMNKKD